MAEARSIDVPDGFPATARFLDGHFEGNPIVPGAVILGRLSAALAENGQRIETIRRMKFTRPLRPDTGFSIVLSPAGTGWRADFRDSDGIFATARLTLASGHV